MSNKALALASKFNADARIEAKVSDSNTTGFISGYAAVWDTVDLDGDVIRRGSFARAIENQIAAGNVSLQVKHFALGGDVTESIGALVEAREDDYGFWVRASLDGANLSQDMRQKVAKNPRIFGMSVGWLPMDKGWRPLPEGGREFSEMNLKEVTLTLLPSQEGTLGTVEGKDATEILRELQERMCALEKRLSGDDVTEPEDAEGTADTVDSEPVTFDFAKAHRERELYLIQKGIKNE
jgi:HK97 family phage prohead protease